MGQGLCYSLNILFKTSTELSTNTKVPAFIISYVFIDEAVTITFFSGKFLDDKYMFLFGSLSKNNDFLFVQLRFLQIHEFLRFWSLKLKSSRTMIELFFAL
jgi:hypothetical protein